MTPNSVDGILFFILFAFAFLAFLKGFVRDFFSTLNLIVAITISYTASPYISQLIKISAPQILMDLVIQFVVFITVLIICSIINSKISHPLSEKIPDALNQSLGFGFGFAKGYLILSFIFAILLFFYSDHPSKESELKIENSKYKEKFGPEWFRDSKSYNILEYGASFLKPLVNNAFSHITNGGGNVEETDGGAIGLETVDKIIKSQKLYDKMLKEDNNPATTDVIEPKQEEVKPESSEEDKSGYTDQEIKKMKRLIEIMSN
jgi:membrane protein required for colicin V production